MPRCQWQQAKNLHVSRLPQKKGADLIVVRPSRPKPRVLSARLLQHAAQRVHKAVERGCNTAAPVSGIRTVRFQPKPLSWLLDAAAHAAVSRENGTAGMAAEAAGSDLIHVVALLAAGVVAVPIFKRVGLGSILGYLAAGVVIGPFGIGIFSESEAILHVAELGVVMFLFIIGLEMQPSRLWGLRREIFGLGALQVGVCALLLTGVGLAGGFPI
ncbi:cation:proton antiporter, partial [Mesorhizobium sp. M5C.F.Ca.IN.020.32.2.1]|uniref:cation:proton antiporter domain-containing protein n=1 Tax=Mesorhizobium sp. M5C.F.Ca.IN.020.32.2.1 TaxID=2496771 RepID=UPI001FE11B62